LPSGSPLRLIQGGLRLAIAAVVMASLLAPAAARGAGLPALRASLVSRTAPHLAKRADFNGDGFTDLATGTRDSGSGDDRGAVAIAYGGPHGVVSAGTTTFTLDTHGIPGVPADRDVFGIALASADFNRDGFAELAIGVPGRHVDGNANAGEVILLRGSASGLTTTGIRVLTEDSSGVPGTPQADDWFGEELAAADFNGDGRPDLAVSAPLEAVQGVSHAGAVDILYGGPAGPGSGGARMFSRATPGVAGIPAQFAAFGLGLAAGDLGRGPQADLAIGVYGDPAGSVDFVGSVTVLYGGTHGLSVSGSQRWAPKSFGETEFGTSGPAFGWALAVGDLGRSSTGDLAIGAINDTAHGVEGGAVFVLYGGPNGLTASGHQRLTEATAGIPNDPTEGDQFGSSLAVGNFDVSGRGDLAVGARYISENGSPRSQGGVYVISGGPNGLVPAQTTFLGGVDLSAQTVDQLWAGSSITAGNFGRGGAPDLVIGIPGMTAGGTQSAGGAAILFGGTGGLQLGHEQLIDRDTLSGFAPTVLSVGTTMIGSPYFQSD
jgi:hypothetical protein